MRQQQIRKQEQIREEQIGKQQINEEIEYPTIQFDMQKGVNGQFLSQPITINNEMRQPVTIRQPVPINSQIRQPVPINSQIRQPVPINSQIRQPVPINNQIRQPVPINNQMKNETKNVDEVATGTEMQGNETVVRDSIKLNTENVSQNTTNKIVLPNYAGMTNEERAIHRAKFRAKFGILRDSWKNYHIPDFSDEISLEEIHVQYDVYIKHLYINQSVDKYKVYLVIGWLLIELICTKMGLNISGILKSQMGGIGNI